jgi:hypothetical protein
VGTCAARSAGIAGAPELGEILVVERALGGERIASLLGAGAAGPGGGGGTVAEPDPSLLAALRDAGRAVTVRSEDLPARLLSPAAPEEVTAAHDLQTAALLLAASRLGVAAAALLIAAEDGRGEQLGEEPLGAAAVRAGRAAAHVLSPSS